MCTMKLLYNRSRQFHGFGLRIILLCIKQNVVPTVNIFVKVITCWVGLVPNSDTKNFHLEPDLSRIAMSQEMTESFYPYVINTWEKTEGDWELYVLWKFYDKQFLLPAIAERSKKTTTLVPSRIHCQLAGSWSTDLTQGSFSKNEMQKDIKEARQTGKDLHTPCPALVRERCVNLQGHGDPEEDGKLC